MQYWKLFKSGACTGDCHFKVGEKSGQPSGGPRSRPAEEEEPKDEEGDNQKEGDAEPSTITPIVKEPPRALVPKAPYPERLQAPRNGGKLEDILEVFKQVQINISFLDAIQQIPSYAKFLKDLVIMKRKMNVSKNAFMT
jgi:hypothetical protein